MSFASTSRLSVWTISSIMFAAALSGSSVYLFPSGLPQPADVVWLSWALMCLVWVGLRSPTVSSSRIRLACLTAWLLLWWIVAVSLVNSAFAANVEMLRHPLFYVFNVLTFVSVCVVGERDPVRFSRVVSIAAMCALGVVLMGLLFTFESGAVRHSGGFNNPNQMAYFTLLLCGIFVLTSPPSQVWGVPGLLVFCATLVVVGFAASLTVMAAMLIVFGAAALKVNRLATVVRVGVVCGLLAFVAVVTIVTTKLGGELSQTVQSRLLAFERKSEDIALTRGYNRIAEFPEYVAFGAGEGALWRFGHEHQLEIHSSWGTLLFSYGIVGLGLFCTLLFWLLKERPLWVWLVVAAPSLYGMTHQGLRTTALWVLLGCVGWVVISGPGSSPRQALPARRRRHVTIAKYGSGSSISKES